MRLRILLPLLLSLGLAAPAQAAEIGINDTLRANKPLGQTASQLGAGWVRIWADWGASNPAPGQWDFGTMEYLSNKVADAKRHGQKVVVVVVRSPAWASGGKGGTTPPTDPSTFGTAMGEFAKRVPAVDAWELWNEQDESQFWAGGADPAKYTAMVKSAYNAIKAVQPHDKVVTGATTGNNFDFIEALYKHGVQGHLDAVAVHTDTLCLVDGPNKVYREPDGRIGRFTFTGYREIHKVMARYGDGDKKIWMTELGWNTQDHSPTSCPSGTWAGQKPLGVNEDTQAQFLTEAYACLAADPLVEVALWFGLQDIPGHSFAAGYGLFRGDGSAKPSAAAFRSVANGVAPKPCGGVLDDSGPRIVVREPTDGQVFKRQMGVDVKAFDDGGVGIRGITLKIDGKTYRYDGDDHFKMPVLWESREWRPGSTHTLTFVAEDEAKNSASVSVKVRKVRKLPAAATAARVAVAPVDATTVRVTGGVTAPRATVARKKVRGKAFVVFQQQQADGSYKTRHRVRVNARRALDLTRALAPGHWRVKLVYPGRKGFKKSASAPVEFDIAAPAPAV